MSARFRQRINKPMKIYLDDIRIPKQDIWTVVRTPEQFRDVISHAQQIDTISFDHDLGECESGYDLMKWLLDLHLDGHKDLSHTQVFIHSANPIGAKNMQMLWSNFQKTL